MRSNFTTWDGGHQIGQGLVWSNFEECFHTVWCKTLIERGVDLGHNSGFVNGNMRLLITANEWEGATTPPRAANDFIEEVIVTALAFPDH